MIEPLASNRSRWLFFNRDGSVAAMCGNAARAAAAWLKHAGKQFPHILETEFGNVVLGEHVVQGPPGFTAKVPYHDKPLAVSELSVDVSHDTTGLIAVPGRLIDTGVPHAVVEIRGSILELALEKRSVLQSLAAKYRWPKEAGHGGSNITFFSRIGHNAKGRVAIEAVTFERGVEDLTLACGTGVLAAAAVAAYERGRFNWPGAGFEVRTPGATLWVESDDFPKSLTLVGPANIVFSAKLISSR